jgi:flagellar hook-associated protein 1 FlgK
VFGASFQIGRSALAAYQAAIAVSGQNIANVGNPEYARQTGRLEALLGGPTLGGVAPGAGVALTRLQRHVDAAVEAQLRAALASRVGAQQTYNVLSQVEGLYNELSDQDLSTQLSNFFNSFATLQTDPTDATSRNLVVSAGTALARTLQRQRGGLLQQVSDLNDGAAAAVRRANEIIAEIARLNEQVVTTQARGNGGEGPLKDRRDGLVRELAEMMDVQVREQENGSINLYVGSEPLVEYNRPRGLTTQRVLVDGIEIASVRFADNNGPVTIRDGQLGRLVETRDVHLRNQIEGLDTLAFGLIYEVNRVHSSGRGLVGYAGVEGTYAVQDPAAAFNTPGAGLTYPVRNGTFLVKVRDAASGSEITRQINVDLDGIGPDTTLQSLASDLDAVPGLTATITPDNRLKLEAAAGSEVSFAEDSSGVLAALGVGAFFDGVDAGTIAVRDEIQQDPRLIAASLTGEPGDGDNAGNLARLAAAPSPLLNNQGVQDFQAALIGALAVEAAAARSAQEAADAVYSSLLAQREAISGVSLDEEAINLTKFEQAFQGATRYISVVQSLGDEVMALLG